MTNITTDFTIVPDIEQQAVAAITTTETTGRMMKLTGKSSSF